MASRSPSWARAKARKLRTPLTARVGPEEHRMLEALTTPAELALFDAQHVADRRHGLGVVAQLRRAGVTDRDVLVAGLLHDCAKGDTGAGPRIVWSLCERFGDAVLRPARAVPGWSAALDRLRDHADTSSDALAAAGLSADAVELVRRQADPFGLPYGAAFKAADDAC